MKVIFDKLINTIISPFTVNFDIFDEQHKGLFSEIRKDIFLGGRPDESMVTELKKVGITHFVSCITEKNRSNMIFLKQNFEHLFLGVHDGIHQDIATKFPQFFDFTSNMPLNQSKLFVHCEARVSRSATLVIAQLMRLEKISFFDAYQSVKSKRNRALPNIGFASQLQRLEFNLIRKKQDTSPSSLALYLHKVCNFPADIKFIQSLLEQNSFDAVAATTAIFDGEIPRVMQGIKL